ncbi:transglycosylase-like protein with SLT domain [Hephaestia caeni]|uniref:Transglycosylase-like protein with SLT domain n=1 Tax=Hephaestia caeni TaxID=645617 RepID=A0A397P9M1_9SPHN|nr:lytic transglycosylase domain-containing protein [Hephaestia caeni]RIA46286.1 transglycosylase-like protein with SLT domain [Hephaestia caeni]
MQPGPSVGTWNASAACGSATYRPSGLLGYAGEARRRSIYDQVHAVACAHGLATDLFDALIIQESRYQPNAISSKQAYGYAQLMPDTARGLGVDRFDPFDNLRGGARYLRAQLDRFGVVDLALSAYNAGPGRVRDRVPEIAETRDYVARVLRNWQWLRGLRPSIPGEPHLMTLDAPPPGRTAAMLSF